MEQVKIFQIAAPLQQVKKMFLKSDILSIVDGQSIVTVTLKPFVNVQDSINASNIKGCPKCRISNPKFPDEFLYGKWDKYGNVMFCEWYS